MPLIFFEIDQEAISFGVPGRLGQWVCRIGSDERLTTLYREPIAGDEFLVVGHGRCETHGYSEGEEGDTVYDGGRAVWSTEPSMFFSQYREMLRTDCQGLRQMSSALEAFLNEEWCRSDISGLDE